MSGERQKIQYELVFTESPEGEARRELSKGIETPKVNRRTEDPASTEWLMEEVCEEGNMQKALARVQANKGSPGVDGMKVEDLSEYLEKHGQAIRGQLLQGTYRPQAVKRVEIPKPDGGVRKLGIPTVLDRFIQQAILQVLGGIWDPTFSEHSYGFRPKRSAHQAVAKAQSYIAEGYQYVVDMDLEKFFDRVNHDMLMGRIAKRITDKRMLKIIRAFLKAGVMEDGLVSAIDEGAPQGGPLSPCLSNMMLDDLDRELERRGHRFVRYADDCNIYVRSERAGQRVMKSITAFITRKLKLKVNEAKSAVDRSSKRKFLGFSFFSRRGPRRRIAPKALERFKRRVRELTGRSRGVSMEQMVKGLREYLIGWRNYFAFAEAPSVLEELESWTRRRLRAALWKQWKRGTKRFKELRKRGVSVMAAAQTAGSAHGPWHLSRSKALHWALPDAYFRSLGLPSLAIRLNA